MVKLQIKIKSPLYNAMQNLARVLHISPTRCHELAMQQFLENQGFKYYPVLKTFVLENPDNKQLQDSLLTVVDATTVSSSPRSKKRTSNTHDIVAGIFNNDSNQTTEKGKRQ